uniref:Uncharacterized protein n=1 Tax=Arion vulgaris TaxID=1028688 RepID=A0A0B7AT88_9EUPU
MSLKLIYREGEQGSILNPFTASVPKSNKLFCSFTSDKHPAKFSLNKAFVYLFRSGTPPKKMLPGTLRT